MDKLTTNAELLSGWGNYPVISCNYAVPASEDDLSRLIESGPLIARGAGRSYGDSAVSKNMTASMAKFNHFLGFDAENGIITVEAGVILKDIISSFLPKGWFVPVTPGTKFVTIGGMIAADVHGKNHHSAKTFGSYIEWIDVMTSDGKIIRCSKADNIVLFNATIGGMGLTGIILRAAFRLIKIESAWLKQEIIATRNFEETYNLLLSIKDATYIVAWIDSLAKKNNLGRALIYSAEHAKASELPDPYNKQPFLIPNKKIVNIPYQSPINFINNFTCKILNQLTYLHGTTKQKTLFIDYNSYFYPLDNILNWNNLYGKNGFTQFQCLIPIMYAKEGILKLLKTVAKSQVGCFLSVLKLLSNQDSFFSFPDEGFTITFDLPLVSNNKTADLINNLHAIVLDHGGRFYLAKDAYLDPKKFYSSDKRAEEFYKLRKKHNMDLFFRSEQSDRLSL